MNYKEMFETELKKYNLNWCKGENCTVRHGHKRGFVLRKDKSTVHYDSKIAIRATLHGGLHEMGHCVNDETGLRTFEKVALAERFANDKMKEFGISVPRKTVALGKDYIRRRKRWGDNIRKGRRLRA